MNKEADKQASEQQCQNTAMQQCNNAATPSVNCVLKPDGSGKWWLRVSSQQQWSNTVVGLPGGATASSKPQSQFLNHTSPLLHNVKFTYPSLYRRHNLALSFQTCFDPRQHCRSRCLRYRDETHLGLVCVPRSVAPERIQGLDSRRTIGWCRRYADVLRFSSPACAAEARRK